MAAETLKSPSRLTRWALFVAMLAAGIGIVLEIAKVALGHPARWEAVLAAMLILIVAFTALRQTRRH